MDSSDSWRTRWDFIESWYGKNCFPIQVLLRATADATAAASIIFELLKAHLILHDVHPVFDCGDIRRAVVAFRTAMGYMNVGIPSPPQPDGESDEDDLVEPRLILLIGCGADVDLSQFFNFRTMTVIVADNTRPVHLANLCRQDPSLKIWGWSTIVREVSAFFVSQRLQRQNSALQDDINTCADPIGAASATWLAHPDTLPAADVRAYYGLVACGRSLACEVYDLAVTLSRVSEEALWFAAIGATDLLQRRLCSQARYRAELSRIRTEVQARRYQRAVTAAERPRGEGSCAQQFSLAPAVEYRALVLLRHWSLWNALWYSGDVANVLDWHSDSGEVKLQTLLATCGVSRRDAERPWASVVSSERQRILQLLQEALKEFFPDFTMTTIARTSGYSAEVTAFDVCILYNALIASPPPPIEGLKSPEKAAGLVATAAREHFWQAEAVLRCSSLAPEFSAAVRAASDLLEVTKCCIDSLLDQRGAIITTSKLHYSIAGDRSALLPLLESFWAPPRLAALATYLADALNYRRRTVPLVLACPIPSELCETQDSLQKAPDLKTSTASFSVICVHGQRANGDSLGLNEKGSITAQCAPAREYILSAAGVLGSADKKTAPGGYLGLANNITFNKLGEQVWLVVHGKDATNALVESVHLALAHMA